MRDSEYKKIQTQYDTLVGELELNGTLVVDYLFQKGVLTRDDKEELNSKSTGQNKNRYLLDILKTKDDVAYKHLHDAVQKEQPHLAAELEPPGIPRTKTYKSSGSGAEKGFEDLTVTDLKEWLKPHLEKENIPDTVLQKISDEEIDGKAFMHMTADDFKEVFSALKFGPRKKLFLLRDEEVKTLFPQQVSTRPELPRHQRTEYAREFGHKPLVSEKYHQNKILNRHESGAGSSKLDPARQFFACVDDNERAEVYDFIAQKVAMFAAACLNDRKNGTIYFGIADTTCNQYSYGEVLGVPLDQNECESAVMQFMKKSFAPGAVEAALKCIKTVVFMEVVLSDRDETDNHFVCEVDIEPKADVVGDGAFFLMLKTTDRETKILYRLENGIPKEQGPDEVLMFSKETSTLTLSRQQEEKSTSIPRMQNLPQILKNYLCGGGDKLDGSYYPLLATGAIDTSQSGFEESLKFVSIMDWEGIFDFDTQGGYEGLYRFLDEKEEMLYKVKTAGDFSSPSFSDASRKSSLDEAFQDMGESELKTWIFCNGYKVSGEKSLKVAEWKRERSAGFKEAVRFFRNSIPAERAVVIILVTSQDDVFIEASEDLLLNFQDQWLMITESKQFADAWIDGLQKRNIEVVRRRCLSDFSFMEVSKTIQQLKGIEAFSEDDCIIKSSSGVDEKLPKKKVQELCDLEIVSSSECKVADSDLSNQALSSLSKEQEEKFYKCNRATWWNFFFSGHVCPRDKLEELKGHTCAALKEDALDGDNVGCVEVYHQPGAGGTTVAMNVVWDLHEKYKCCLVKRITGDTAKQILALYEFAEGSPDRGKPVLAMIDNEDEKIDDLKRSIEEECQSREIHNLVCVFLLCLRRMTLPSDHQPRNILLVQKLSKREKQFFVDKYGELKKRDRANLDHLLGLNIMKEDFNDEYIRRTVKQFVGPQNVHEKTVLKYTALLNCYDLSFRAIPVACYDQLMAHQRHGRALWESKLTPDPLMLFITSTKLSGRNKCLRITSQLLCKYILDELSDDSTHADTMEEFLCSPAFTTHFTNFAFKELLNIVKDCMKKRGMAADGKKRSKFSSFIQRLYDDGEIEMATRCIQLVYERSNDAFLAQQIARIYICSKNWDKADEWAMEATKRLPSNSFLWDTRGQICRFRLADVRAECEASHDAVSPQLIANAVKYAHEGINVFEKVEELSQKERNDPPNTSGLFGQMEIVLLLGKILKLLPSISSKVDIQGLFSGKHNLPLELQNTAVQNYLPWLQSVQDSTFQCLKSVEDRVMMFSADAGFTHTPTKFFLSENNIHQFEDRLNDLFGEDPSDSDPQRIAPDKRQRLARKLGGNSLYSIMKQCGQGEEGKERAEKILQLCSLNLKQTQSSNSWSRYDLTMALASALALESCHGHVITQDHSDFLRWSMALFEQFKKQNLEKYINLDPYIFLLVFHWPTARRQSLQVQEQCAPAVLNKAAELAKEAFMKMNTRGNVLRKRNNPIFFLTKKPDCSSVISKHLLQEICNKKTEKMVNKLLRHTKAVEVVERFTGVLVKNGTEVKVEHVSKQGNRSSLTVPLLVRERSQTLWNKKIYFALGIGLGGPVACGIDTTLPTPPSQSAQTVGRGGRYDSPVRPYVPPIVKTEKEIEEVRHMLVQIRFLKSKQSRTVSEEKLVREELDLKKRLTRLQQHRRELELDSDWV